MKKQKRPKRLYEKTCVNSSPRKTPKCTGIDAPVGRPYFTETVRLIDRQMIKAMSLEQWAVRPREQPPAATGGYQDCGKTQAG